MNRHTLQWHPAFQAALQIELIDDSEYLDYKIEFNLTKKPLQIDTLIVKLEPGYQITKNIGRIFRQHNIIEYKNPSDYISINDFYKVNGYASIYQANTEKELDIPPEEITVTLAGNHYPRKLIVYLKKAYHAGIVKAYPGVYYITGLIFPLQILVTKQLSKKENFWLSRLRSDLDAQEDIEPLAKAYRGKENSPLYSAAMDFIIRANWETYKEVNTMCDALRELFAEELEEQGKRGLERGKADSIIDLLSDLGPVPEAVLDLVYAQKDLGVLTSWLKLAAKSDSIESFQKNLNTNTERG
ncbi:3-isopropylmalate dehydrogenase [Hungatella hathewayi]|uniref:3-isopropylmalate dehydrogenase n=1 Tax=Hungatella hathewayi TaxID=154046 RepID=UPI003567BA2D